MAVDESHVDRAGQYSRSHIARRSGCRDVSVPSNGAQLQARSREAAACARSIEVAGGSVGFTARATNPDAIEEHGSLRRLLNLRVFPEKSIITPSTVRPERHPVAATPRWGSPWSVGS